MTLPQIKALFLQIVGEDEWDQQEYDDTPNGSFVPFIERNLLRKQLRDKINKL